MNTSKVVKTKGKIVNIYLILGVIFREGLHKSSPQPPRALSSDEPNKPRHHRI